MNFPSLGYSYDALEPYIDKETMQIHYEKHHKSYYDKLQKALEKTEEKNIIKLLKNPDKIPKDIRQTIINQGGGHVNHSFFWPLLKKNVELSGEIKERLEKDFGSIDNFQQEFKNTSLKIFGSGWTWLVLDKDNNLDIISTKNQDNPMSIDLIPILGLDVWEHAYYLKYQNKRAEYIDSFFEIINWEQVNKNLQEAKNN